MTTLQKEKASALRTLLEYEHATEYMGTDDDMSDKFNDWLSSLDEEEICQIILSVFREGI